MGMFRVYFISGPSENTHHLPGLVSMQKPCPLPCWLAETENCPYAPARGQVLADPENRASALFAGGERRKQGSQAPWG